MVESTQEVEGSEVSTEIEEGRLEVEGEDSERQEGQGVGDGRNDSKDIEKDMYEDESTCEGSTNDGSMCEESR